jgi:hypothetical protein
MKVEEQRNRVVPGPASTTAAPAAHDGGRAGDHVGGVGAGLRSLVALELELGWTEGRRLLRAAVVAAALAAVGLIVFLASLVVLAAGLVGLGLGLPWPHLVWSGGAGAVLGVLLAAVGAHRMKGLRWPQEVSRSLEETLQWLGAQLRYRLRFG